jgi:hypothetical protein
LLKLAPPLTESNRRADRARRHDRPNAPSPARAPRPQRRCRRRGGEVPNRDRTYCDDCLPHYQRQRHEAFIAAGRAAYVEKRTNGVDPSHGGDAAKRRGATISRGKRELQERKTSHPDTIADPGLFAHEILPMIRDLPLSDLVRATGLTHGYLSQVRRGDKVPHPRHWPNLRAAGGFDDLLSSPPASRARVRESRRCASGEPRIPESRGIVHGANNSPDHRASTLPRTSITGRLLPETKERMT